MASEGQRGPIQRLQSAVEHLSGKDNIPEGVYLDACNALKQIHSPGKLCQVCYIFFYDDDGTVGYECNSMIVPLHNTEDDPTIFRSWGDILTGCSILNTVPPLPAVRSFVGAPQ